MFRYPTGYRKYTLPGGVGISNTPYPAGYKRPTHRYPTGYRDQQSNGGEGIAFRLTRHTVQGIQRLMHHWVYFYTQTKYP